MRYLKVYSVKQIENFNKLKIYGEYISFFDTEHHVSIPRQMADEVCGKTFEDNEFSVTSNNYVSVTINDHSWQLTPNMCFIYNKE